jgi:[citrate (pro-3S)-lyase] ligase
VLVFGAGPAFGIGSEDKYTFPSLLQEQLNSHAEKSGGRYLAENYGVCGDGVSEKDVMKLIEDKIRDGSVADGDIVIWFMDKRYSITESDKMSFAYLRKCLERLGIHFLDLTHTMRIAQKKRVYIDKKHVNHRGNKMLASKIYFDYVKNVLEGKIGAPDRSAKFSQAGAPELSGEQNEDFRDYLKYLESEREKTAKSAGAVVVNCNPFTLGHRHLIERAASETGFLYVFVVEEDRSFFSFADRFRLVSEGLKDLKNVTVLRSGRFIISTVTFPGYFDKDSAKEAVIDASLDLELFAKYIAPSLAIKTRFAGSEPLDAVTRQYNAAMEETLPKYGINFSEFDRIGRGGGPISASRVRALLEKRDFAGIKPLVPEITYTYLLERFGGQTGEQTRPNSP